MKIHLPLVLLLALFTRSFGQAVYTNYVDGRVYVKMTGASLKTLRGEDPNALPLSKLGFLKEIVSKYGVTRVYKPFHQAVTSPVLPNILKLEFSKTSQVEQLIRDLEKVSGVEYAEKVPLMKTDIVPNDPVFPPHLTQINAVNAWNVFNGGSNITVAIVDNAVMWTHFDLAANTFTNTGEIANNNIDDDANGYIDDVNGYDVADNDPNAVPTNTAMDHGTHCAGIAGACTNNTVGIASIGWNIKIIPVKTQNDGGSTNGIAAGYEGIVYAANMNARVISCSWGGSGAALAEQAVVDYAWNRGCIVVAAAGNANTTTQNYPGAYNHVYCVASVSSSDIKSGFSNYGTWVDISAPGENVYSTTPSATTGTFLTYSGTSMATPLVAGLAGLMLSKCPVMTQTDVLNCISSTAVNIYTLAGNSSFVTNSRLGAGRIEAFAAMNCAASFTATPPIANFRTPTRNTCPLTAVQFLDSSQYAPTTWNWVFQGGTPATSTLSNPSVQWTAPGTYSVMLTVSNGNGSDSETKLAYITVAGPINLPLQEGFQASTFLPANWTENNIYNDVIYWDRVTGLGGFGTSTACARFDNYNIDALNERDEMRTPKYSFSNVGSARLRFDVAYARFNSSYSDSLEVKLSTNCGATWTTIYSKGGSTLSTVPADVNSTMFVPTAAQWRRDTIDISTLTAGQGNVMFSFINRGHYGQPIYLDNINLVFPTPTVNISAPAQRCTNSSFNFTNTSIGVGSYSWSLPGGSPASSTSSNPSVAYPSAGLYTVTILLTNGTTTTQTTRTVNIVAPPVVTVNTPTVCPGNIAVLTASGAATYSWTNGPLTASLSVSPGGTSFYTVTGTSNGCSVAQTATIVVTPAPSISINSATICSGNTAVITASGASTYSWINGPNTASLSVSPSSTSVYSVSGSNAFCSATQTSAVFVTTTPTVSVANASVCQGASALITAGGATTYSWNTNALTNTISVSPAVTTVYTVTGSNAANAISCTDTKTSTLTVVVNPTVTIAASSTILCLGGSVTLTALGANSYSWSNGASTATQVVSPATTTGYVVTGTTSGCISVAITTIIVLPVPTLSINPAPPASVCPGTSVVLNASAGFTAYTWSTNPIISAATATLLPSGNANYTLTGTTSGGCTSSFTFSIGARPQPVIALQASNANCSNACSGAISANSSGGTAPFSYTLLPTVCALPCNNLCAGNYTLVASNSEGCTSSSSFVIQATANTLSATVSGTNTSCSTCADGNAAVNLGGGTAPYTYSWSPSGSTQATANGLQVGCYTVTATDANGCQITRSLCITASPVSTTGITGQAAIAGDLRIYPNPASGKVTIELPEHRFHWSVYNALGQLVIPTTAAEGKTELSLEAFARGIYYIEVETGSTRCGTKLVVE